MYDNCIYCKKNQIKSNFSNREHVIPQAFGLFEPENFILNDKTKPTKHVCNKCNSNFGNSIDRWLAKDSYEGYVLRSKYLKNVKSQDRRRVSIKIFEGELKGLNMLLAENNSVETLPQIGILNKNNEWEYFLLNEVSNIDKNNYKLSDNEAKDIFSKIRINFFTWRTCTKTKCD